MNDEQTNWKRPAGVEILGDGDMKVVSRVNKIALHIFGDYLAVDAHDFNKDRLLEGIMRVASPGLKAKFARLTQQRLADVLNLLLQTKIAIEED